MSAPVAIAERFVVARPRGCRARTRLRPTVSEADVLAGIGAHLGSLRLVDLTDRLELGRVGGDGQRARRKKALTPECSSRWAGSITRANNDQYGLAMRGLTAHIDSLNQAVSTLGKRLAVHRGTEWVDRVHAGQAVRYDIRFDPGKGRWYLDASWTVPVPDHVPTPEQLTAGGMLGVDLNADHLAAHVVDPSGNPVGAPVTIPLILTGLPASTRDARLRDAISVLLRIARNRGCAAIGIENLDFADARATGRDTLGRGRRGKQFRRTIASIPTSQFRDRLAAMAAAADVWIIAVDPRNTSKHGAKFWKPELARRRTARASTGHHAAAAMIARRALRLRITRTRHSPGRDSGHGRASVAGAPQASARQVKLPPPATHPSPGTGIVLADTG